MSKTETKNNDVEFEGFDKLDNTGGMMFTGEDHEVNDDKNTGKNNMPDVEEGENEMIAETKEDLNEELNQLEEQAQEEEDNINEKILEQLNKMQKKINRMERNNNKSRSGKFWLVNGSDKKVGIKFQGQFVKSKHSLINKITALTVRKTRRYADTTGYYGKIKVGSDVYKYELFKNNQVRFVNGESFDRKFYLELTDIVCKHVAYTHDKLSQ